MTLLDVKNFVDKATSSNVAKGIDWLVKYVILIIIGIIMLFPQVIYENYEKYSEYRHGQLVEKRIENSVEVRECLNVGLMELKADRIYVCEFHNGTNNFAGLPFLYLDMKYEVVRIGADNVDDEYINFNLTRYTFVPYALHKGYWSGTVDEINRIDARFAGNIYRDNVGYIALSEISGTENTIGAIGVSYFNEDHNGVSEETIRKELTKLGTKIGILLSAK